MSSDLGDRKAAKAAYMRDYRSTQCANTARQTSERDQLVELLKGQIDDLKVERDWLRAAYEKLRESYGESYVTLVTERVKPAMAQALPGSSGLARADTFSSSLSLSEEDKKSKTNGEFQDLNGKTREHAGYLATGLRVPGRLGDENETELRAAPLKLRNRLRNSDPPAAAVLDLPEEQKSEPRRKLDAPLLGSLTQDEIDARRAEQLRRLRELEDGDTDGCLP